MPGSEQTLQGKLGPRRMLGWGWGCLTEPRQGHSQTYLEKPNQTKSETKQRTTQGGSNSRRSSPTSKHSLWGNEV